MPRLRRLKPVLLGAALGLISGAAVWAIAFSAPPLLRPQPQQVAQGPVPAIDINRSLSRLTASPIRFRSDSVGSSMLKAAPPASIASAHADVRLHGISRDGSRSRALISAGGLEPTWMRVGQCFDTLCLRGLDRSSARLTIGEDKVTARMFEAAQKAEPPVSELPGLKGASMPPVQPPVSPQTEASPISRAAPPADAPVRSGQ